MESPQNKDFGLDSGVRRVYQNEVYIGCTKHEVYHRCRGVSQVSMWCPKGVPRHLLYTSLLAHTSVRCTHLSYNFHTECHDTLINFYTGNVVSIH